MDEGKGRLNEERHTQESMEIMDTDTKGVKLNVKKGRIYHKINQLGRNISGG